MIAEPGEQVVVGEMNTLGIRGVNGIDTRRGIAGIKRPCLGVHQARRKAVQPAVIDAVIFRARLTEVAQPDFIDVILGEG